MGRRYGLLFQLKEVHRVHPAATGTIGPDLKMKMVSCGIASGTYLPDHLALYNGITHRNQPCTHVCIHRSASVRMGYGNMIPERGPISRKHNCPAFCRQDIRPIRCREVNPSMQLPSMVGAMSIPERRGNPGVPRQRPEVVPVSFGGEFVPEGVILQDNRRIFRTAIAAPPQFLRHHLRKFNGVGF